MRPWFRADGLPVACPPVGHVLEVEMQLSAKSRSMQRSAPVTVPGPGAKMYLYFSYNRECVEVLHVIIMSSISPMCLKNGYAHWNLMNFESYTGEKMRMYKLDLCIAWPVSCPSRSCFTPILWVWNSKQADDQFAPCKKAFNKPDTKNTHTHIAWVRKCCTMWVGSCQSYPTNSQCCKCYKTKWAPGSAGYIYLLIFGPHNVAILLKIHEHMCIRSARRLG